MPIVCVADAIYEPYILIIKPVYSASVTRTRGDEPNDDYGIIIAGMSYPHARR